MNCSNQQQAIDEIIGEAAFALLQDGGAINLRALIVQLNEMQRTADDVQRQTLILLALAEIRQSREEGNALPKVQNESTDNAFSHFSELRISPTKQKH
jgi:hypothetical protein